MFRPSLQLREVRGDIHVDFPRLRAHPDALVYVLHRKVRRVGRRSDSLQVRIDGVRKVALLVLEVSCCQRRKCRMRLE